jgi:ubiquinol-cytochrome c reductase cytochrome b subunit
MYLFLALSFFVFFDPGYLGHPDNNVPANPLVTPLSIVPEFYLLPFYAILRAIPSKLGGVVAKIGALLILIPLSFFHVQGIRSLRFRPAFQYLFWSFASNFLFLLW